MTPCRCREHGASRGCGFSRIGDGLEVCEGERVVLKPQRVSEANVGLGAHENREIREEQRLLVDVVDCFEFEERLLN